MLPDNINVVNLHEKYGRFRDLWTPHIVGQVNDHQVKIAKVKGEFVWHSHENEDELFLIIKGKLFIDLRGKTLELNEGEMVVLPKGVEHRPRTNGDEAWILLLEPTSTLHTGNTVHDLTKNNQKHL